MNSYIINKLKVYNKKLLNVKGHDLIELEQDLRSICCILSLQFLSGNEYFDFKCLKANHIKYEKESLDYIIYKVRITKRILILLVSVSEPCQYTCHLPWSVLDDNKWVYIGENYPRLKNPFQEKTDINNFNYEEIKDLNNRMYHLMSKDKNSKKGI